MKQIIISSFYIFAGLIFILLLIVLLFIILRFYKNEKEEKQFAEERYNVLEKKLQSLELETIKYKLNPHLFKNTLNSIQSHAYQTYYALDKLSNVLDFILYESDRNYVSLKEETEFALNLIEINRLKVSPLFDLRVKNKIDSASPFYEYGEIAPLITIDLIENAFKHADLQSDQSFISITFELKQNIFSLTVSNKMSMLAPVKKQNSGFGNSGLEKRLEILYKDMHTLKRYTENDIYVAQLTLNLSK
ncbi:MAG TPA: histidine kinase [Arachidicoccus sp.]